MLTPTFRGNSEDDEEQNKLVNYGRSGYNKWVFLSRASSLARTKADTQTQGRQGRQRGEQAAAELSIFLSTLSRLIFLPCMHAQTRPRVGSDDSELDGTGLCLSLSLSSDFPFVDHSAGRILELAMG